MTTDGIEKPSTLPIILLLVLVLGGICAGGWFGYRFYANKQQEERARIAEEQRQAEIAKEVSSLLKSARAAYDEKKREEALGIVNEALIRDPKHAEARQWQAEMSEAIDLEKLIPVKKLAEARWAATKSLSPGQGFAEPLQKLEILVNDSEKLFGIKDYKNAKTNYQDVADGCERLMALDAERQQARSIRDESDKARDAADKAKAEEETPAMWADAREKEGEGTTAFESGDFARASEAWKISLKMFNDAAVFSGGIRAVRAVESAYNDVLASARAGLLDTFGGQKWTDTKGLADKGKQLAGEQRWADSVNTWVAATDSLRDAITTALVEEARDKMRKEFNVAMSAVGASLEECVKTPKSDRSKIAVLQRDIATLDGIKANANYGLLSDDEHKALDRMSVSVHREKFCFRYPDLVQIDEPREIMLSELAGGSADALAAQAKSVVDMDGSVEVKTRKTGISMRLIPAGSFVAGRRGNEDGDRDEVPSHAVVMNRPFYAGVFEVTQEQFAKSGAGKNQSFFRGDGTEGYPAETVTFSQATAFCNWLCDEENMPRGTYRLPTEAEWEYACRAGTDARFYSGDSRNDLQRAGWFKRNSDGGTHPAGRKLPNAYGLYDMHGNVWEWCSDGARTYSGITETDPVGPSKGFTVNNRGGSWRDDDDVCRSANRGWARKKYLKSYDLGLRIIRVLPPEEPVE